MSDECVFELKLTNRSDFKKNIRIELPTDRKTFENALKLIGLPENVQSDKYFLSDFETPHFELRSVADILTTASKIRDDDIVPIHYSINVLNYFAELFDNMTYGDKAILSAVLEGGLHNKSLEDVINIILNTESFEIINDMYSWEDIGRHFAENNGLDRYTLDFLEDYIDYEKLGEVYAEQNNCKWIDEERLLDTDTGVPFEQKFDGDVLTVPESCRVIPLEREPEFFEDMLQSSMDLALSLDNFFRHHNREYAENYADSQSQCEYLSDCLLSGDFEFINKWLYDLGQDEHDELPIEVREFDEKFSAYYKNEKEEHQMNDMENEKTITVLVVEPMKEPYAKEIGSGLESLQKEVGGDIEVIYPYDDLIGIICNEEGKINGMELNRAIFDDDNKIIDIMAGTFLVAGLEDESFGSMPDDLMSKYKEMFKEPQRFFKLGNEIVAVPVKPSIRKQLNTNKEQDSHGTPKPPEKKTPEL